MSNRRAISSILPLVLCLVALAALVPVHGSFADTETMARHVATTGTDDGDCSLPNEPCRTVQYAVNVANDGDVVKLATGTYTGVESRPSPPGYNGPTMITQLVYIGKTITVRGGYTTSFSDPPDPESNPTTLDAQGQGRVLFIAGDISPTVERLRITGGDAEGLEGWGQSWDSGGGVYILSANATLRDNLIYSNTALGGGGLYLVDSHAILDGNSVSNNTTGWGGGGLYLVNSDATIKNNTISENEGGEFDGGGVVLSNSDATFSNNTVSMNSANKGGGLYLSSSDATLSSNLIKNNTAFGGGGGLALLRSSAELSGNTISDNTAEGHWDNGGGGLFLNKCSPVLTNNFVTNNQSGASGSALYIQASSPTLLHNTIAHNTGGGGIGIYVTDDGATYSQVALSNTILVNHSVGVKVASGSSSALEGTLWYGNTVNRDGAGVINHTGDWTGSPSFVNPGTGDYHIGSSSAAVDKGVDASVTVDIDGDARPQGNGYDIGADELRIVCSTPAVPTLSSPPDGSSTYVSKPGFQWLPVVGATEYRVRVVEVESGTVMFNEKTSKTYHTSEVSLPTATYYWRVEAFNACGDSGWSTRRSLTVLSTGLAAPQLSVPLDQSTTCEATPSLEWGQVPEATWYRIQVDVDNNFLSPLVDHGTSSTAYKPGSPLDLGTYYWRVRAMNDSDVSDWSPSFSLTRVKCLYVPLVRR